MNNIKRNYQKELEAILKKLPQEKVPTLLLHSCCAPCSSYCLEYLSDYFEITIFYFNPNIYPEEEYRKRVEEQASGERTSCPLSDPCNRRNLRAEAVL